MTRTSIFQALRGREETPIEAIEQRSAPLFQPTYAEKLRLIGMHLDINDMGAMRILDVPGGMLVRGVGPDHVTDELLEFPDAIFPDLFAEATSQRGKHDDRGLTRIKSEIIPTSYADVLRTLGSHLDGWAARSILISEGQASMYVSGMRLVNNSLRSSFAPFEEILYPDDIDRMLTAAFRHRGLSD